MLEAAQVTCVRGERPLFQDLSFTLEPGCGLHLAGANGSGKTSLLRLLCGLGEPAAGEVRWDGSNVRSLREEFYQQLVYVGHASAVKDDLTAVENLVTAVTLSGLVVREDEAREALRRIGLGGREDLPAKVLSQGQRRRVVLARLMLSLKTPLWVLDEPFTALDRRAVDELRLTMEAHLKTGGLIVFTTHQDVSMSAGVIRRFDLDDAKPC